MALTLGDNFSYQGAKPLDARLKYDTLANMKAVADATMYEGCLAYCVATEKTYQWKSTNTVDESTGKWREYSSGGGGTSDYSDLTNKPSINNVTLSGNKTSSDLGLQDAMQVSTMPTASADLLNKVVQFVGATDSTYTHGYYYECVSDGEATPTYSWQNVPVQEDSAGHTIEDEEGTALTQRDTLQFGEGLSAEDDSTNEKSVVALDPMPSEDLDEIFDGFTPTGNTVAVRAFTPLGTILPLFAETAPKFFLACDGATYDKADYPELAEHLLSLTTHSQYEVDGDATKFKVPDLQGEFLRGTGTNSHEYQGDGANVGVHQDGTAEFNLTITSSGLLRWRSSSSGITQENKDKTYRNSSAYKTVKSTSADSGEDSSTMYHTVRPTNTSVLFCIAYKDIYTNPINEYSTTEKVIGTWLDGSIIYQKTVYTATLKASGTDTVIAHGISNLNHVINAFGYTYGGTGTARRSLLLPYYNNGNWQCSFYVNDVNVVIQVGSSFYTAHKNHGAYVTVQYTKTSD